MTNAARLVAMVCLMLGVGATRAVSQPDPGSTNDLMPGCWVFLAPSTGPDLSLVFKAALCAGKVEGIFETAESVHLVCPPPGVITDQAMRVIVQFVDARPARMHESFNLLALEALIAAWPCK
jgi:hypothetical protein